MSYAGTTAPSSLQNVPVNLVPAMSGPKATSSADSTAITPRNRSLWFYNTSDGTSVLCTDGYFTDGKQLGMKHGDAMLGVSWTTFSATGSHTFLGMLYSSNSTAGFNLSTDSMVSSSFT